MLTTDAVIAEAAKEWLPRKKAAELLAALGCPVSWRTLERWAEDDNHGKGPPFTKTRRIIRYRRTEIIEWVNKEARRIK